jgi:putative ribosome biogenesis GTPase RsgA
MIDLDERWKGQQIVIIFGMTGIGKSTIISHYYK